MKLLFNNNILMVAGFLLAGQCITAMENQKNKDLLGTCSQHPTKKRIEKAMQLLNEGADPNCTFACFTGMTPLYYLASYSEYRSHCYPPGTISPIELIKLLIVKGADLEARTTNGVNLLHRAVAFGALQTVQCFIDAKANVNALDNDGNNALHFSTQPLSNSDIPTQIAIKQIKILAAAGCNINQENREGNVPIVKCLSDFFYPSPYPNNRPYKEKLQILQTFFECGANPNMPNSDGNFPLHMAICHKSLKANSDIVRLFINNGAHPNEKESNGNTPLLLTLFQAIHYPLQMGNMAKKIALSLITEFEVDLDIRNIVGESAWTIFAENPDLSDLIRPHIGQYAMKKHQQMKFKDCDKRKLLKKSLVENEDSFILP